MPPTLATRLSALDLALVAIYLVAITIFGLRFAKRAKTSGSLKTYFLADNTIPWWAIALSIVSAETSTLTIISIPGVAFAGNFGFLQIVLGYMLGLSESIASLHPGQPASFNQYTPEGRLEATYLHGRKIAT